jgi:hypothetical protein
MLEDPSISAKAIVWFRHEDVAGVASVPRDRYPTEALKQMTVRTEKNKKVYTHVGLGINTALTQPD